MVNNAYQPLECVIEGVVEETPDIKTFTVKPVDAKSPLLNYQPGQFMELSVFGAGECPISITSSPTQKGVIQFSIKNVGSVTDQIHMLEKGESIFVRGPYGNTWPLEDLKGKDIVFIGGGVGLPPLRSLLNYLRVNRKDYGKIHVLYGARTPDDLVFKKELVDWAKDKGIDTVLTTVDRGDKKWKGRVGVVPKLVDELKLDQKNTRFVICGPGIMIKFTILGLQEKGFTDDQIIVTMERMMKCGLGKCGHCNIGSKYVCLDGPVFTIKELKKEKEFEL